MDLPQPGAHTAHARIYTPAMELPFAGHPTMGASWWLHEKALPIRTLRVPAGIVAVSYENGLTIVHAPVPSGRRSSPSMRLTRQRR